MKPRLGDRTKWGRIFAMGKPRGRALLCWMTWRGTVTVKTAREVGRAGRLRGK